MTPQTKMLVLFFVAMTALLVYVVGRIVGVWAEHHLSRHDLIVQSKQRRQAYLKALADRERGADAAEAGGVVIEPEAEAPPLAKAA